MLNILSGFIGLVTLVLMIPAFIPLLGALNWLLVPMALFGAVIGAISSRNGGRNLNILVIVICAVRLAMTGGTF